MNANSMSERFENNYKAIQMTNTFTLHSRSIGTVEMHFDGSDIMHVTYLDGTSRTISGAEEVFALKRQMAAQIQEHNLWREKQFG